MEEIPKTAALQDIENKMEQVEGDDFRHALLEKARVFKSGWVELGEVLSRVAKSNQFKDWGYKSIEDYCLKELHIRRNTVAKLIGNYNFLSRREPQLLEKDSLSKMPDLDSMNALAKASDKVDDETYVKLKEGAIDRGYTAATLHRQIHERKEHNPAEKEELLRKRISSLVSSIRLLFVEKGGVPDKVDHALGEIREYLAEDEAAAEAAAEE